MLHVQSNDHSKCTHSMGERERERERGLQSYVSYFSFLDEMKPKTGRA